MRARYTAVYCVSKCVIHEQYLIAVVCIVLCGALFTRYTVYSNIYYIYNGIRTRRQTIPAFIQTDKSTMHS